MLASTFFDDFKISFGTVGGAQKPLKQKIVTKLNGMGYGCQPVRAHCVTGNTQGVT